MRLRSLGAALAAVVLAIAGDVRAADRVVGGRKLLLKQSLSGSEKLVFVSPVHPANPDVPVVPAVGGQDDLATGSPGGALLELFAFGNPVPATASPSACTGSSCSATRTPTRG